MPLSNTLTYNRDTTIAAITSYYDFLTKLYMPASAVMHSPDSGWPSITSTTFAALGKTDEVVDLLRHLPYIDRIADVPCAPHCYFADYSTGIDEGTRELTEPYEGTVEPHVVGLTLGGRDNLIFLLDTKLGVVHWVDCPSELTTSREQVMFVKEDEQGEEENDADDEHDEEEEESWRDNAPAWTAEDFFELLKEEYLAMNFVPTSAKEVFDVYSAYADEDKDLVPNLQQVLREHGWPDVENFRKEECLKALERTASAYLP
ncbi:hypothetical protein BDV96DRAFT_634903 [Lophiotrema nucula]|uniref:Uncharacterized protein n=1 Tax=Lophiotrema nucula TaxID=690887 RepID=A0A6A5YVY2_9PLEO|nr:hypothetical protein BDV96DRAFT_634903 [Lophiotrema nucula]